MKAWVVNEFKNKENLELENIDLGELTDNQVLINIKACGINNKDIFIRKGIYFRKLDTPLILGSDIAGIISKVGKDVKEFKVNNRVLISPISGCSNCEYCLKGEENKCSQYDSILGGFAEQIIVDKKQLVQIPESMTFIEAASLPISYLTAWNMLYIKAEVKQTDHVLFWGGSSGVGTAGILLFNNLENTIAIAGSEEKLKKLREIGITKVINYKKDNVFDKIMFYTDGAGIDVIFDPVGKAAWKDNLRALKNNGRHVNCARNTGSEVQIDLSLLFSKQISLFGAKSGSKKDLIDIVNYLDKNNLTPIIDKTFTFEEAETALQYMDSGEHFGKVILTNI